MRTAPLRRDAQVLGQVRIADGPLGRALGLVGRKASTLDQALLLVPCAAIHTFGMRFAIDVVFLDREGVIVAARAHVAPWRWARGKGAYATLEWAAGAIGRYGFEVGQRLQWGGS